MTQYLPDVTGRLSTCLMILKPILDGEIQTAKSSDWKTAAEEYRKTNMRDAKEIAKHIEKILSEIIADFDDIDLEI